MTGQKQLLKGIKDFTKQLCGQYKDSFNATGKLASSINELGGATNQDCARFSQVEQIANDANQKISNLQKGLDQGLVMVKTVFKKMVALNRAALDSLHAEADKNADTDPFALERSKAGLEEEYRNIWGTEGQRTIFESAEFHKRKPFTQKVFFGDLVRALDQISDGYTRNNYDRNQYAEQLRASRGSCGNLTNSTLPPAPKPEDPNSTLPQTRSAPEGSKVCDDKVSGTTIDLNGAMGCAQPGASRGGIDTDDRGTDTLSGGRNNPEKTDEEKDNKEKNKNRSETPVPPKKEESWFSKNSDLLIMGGVGAAAVGGLIYYMKTEDDKKKDKARDMELEAAAAAMTQQQQQNNSSGGDSSSDDGSSNDSFAGGPPAAGQTPQGSTLMVEGTPAGASVNQTITTFVVKVVGPNGVMTQDSATDITVSCMDPQPCGLEGTLTVNTDQGKAEFKDIRIKIPNMNVRLQFQAPGFAPVGSSSFSVGNQ